jgi:hypothetical protein
MALKCIRRSIDDFEKNPVPGFEILKNESDEIEIDKVRDNFFIDLSWNLNDSVEESFIEFQNFILHFWHCA